MDDKLDSMIPIRPPLYCPERPSGTQRAFLAAKPIEALFGGACGGGKTSALLMAALQYVDIPDYNAIIFRRTFRDLFQPYAVGDRFRMWIGIWMDECDEVKWDNRTYCATFPSGARIHFGYLDDSEDYKRYKACNFHFIGMDQAEEIRERDYRYLFSKLRRLSSGPASLIPLRMRLTAIPASDGSSDWIRKRFILEEDENRVFIPSYLTDNPGIDQDAYLASLFCLKPVECHRLLHGHWFTSERRNNMPITEKDVEQVRKHVEKNSFYVDINPYTKPHPSNLVGKDLFVIAYEFGENTTQPYSRLKLIVREHE